MIKDRFDAFPPAHRDAARAALVAAFGPAPIGAVTALTGGATSASVYRVEAGDRRYLLRIEGAPSPLRNPHQYQSMRIAAEAGIAPKIHHVDEAARIAVIDFIEQVPLTAYPGGPFALAQALGELIARVQATPVFPSFVHYPDIVTRLFAHVRRTELFAEGILDPHFERLERSAKHTAKVPTGFQPQRPGAEQYPVRWPKPLLIDWDRLRNDPPRRCAIALDGVARCRSWRGAVAGLARPRA